MKLSPELHEQQEAFLTFDEDLRVFMSAATLYMLMGDLLNRSSQDEEQFYTDQEIADLKTSRKVVNAILHMVKSDLEAQNEKPS